MLRYGDNYIEIVRSIKYLGVTVSESLNWDAQVKNIRSKMNKENRVLCRQRYVLSTRIRRIIYNAFLVPILNYCHNVWGTSTIPNLSNFCYSETSDKVSC